MAAPNAASTAATSRSRRLGVAYAKLWTAASVSYAGDGIYYTALPLLAATLTRDPLRVAAVDVAGQLPWLLFALPAGALVDRWDRRRILWLTDAYRGLVLAALAVAVVAGWASIPVLAAAGFLLGTGGTLFTPASLSIIPAIVSRERARLERANGRLAASQTVGLHFLGPPAGGALFSLARSVPFVADAVSFVVSAAALASIRGRFTPDAGPLAHGPAPAGVADAGQPGDHPQSVGSRRLRVEIVQGLRWLAGQRLLRMLALMNATTSLAFGAWTAIMVLFAQDRLGVGNLGYGLLWTGVAAGSLLGSLLAARLSRVVGQARLLIASAVAFGVTTLGVGASTTQAWVAGGLLGTLGLALTVWNVVVVSLRQAIVPDHLVGRINSNFQLASMGMGPLGAALGGILGRALGLRAPFFITGAVLLLMAAAAIPVITTRAIGALRTDPS
jgi:MFS family permease